MSEIKHTPGPWRLGADASLPSGRTVQTENGIRIAFIMERSSGLSHDECEANARVMAAGPELLKALEGLAAECGCSQCLVARVLIARVKEATVQDAVNRVGQAEQENGTLREQVAGLLEALEALIAVQGHLHWCRLLRDQVCTCPLGPAIRSARALVARVKGES